MPDSEKIGKAKKPNGRFRDLFRRDKHPPNAEESKDKPEHEVELDIQHVKLLSIRERKKPKEKATENAKKAKSRFFSFKKKSGDDTPSKSDEKAPKVKSLNPIQRFAFAHLSPLLPTLPGYRDAYEQAGMPLIYESYLSTAFLLSFIITIPIFAVSFLLEYRIFGISPLISLLSSFVLGFIAGATSLLVWLLYPLQRRRTFKSKLEKQLAYSFGILGALSAAGIGVERLFERLAATESNPVLAELARRFLRNVKVFGLDTESALREVGMHSPSLAFSKMLDSIAVAYKTSGSMKDLVSFESARLFNEKKDSLKKSVNDLSVMAELYITLVVVGPIIFIVMLTIFTILPSTGSKLPPPTGLINLIVFLGIPAVSVVFTIILDSMVSRM